MDERIFGYVRVSSKDQNEDRQIIAMEEFGVPPRIWFVKSYQARILTVPDIVS